MVINEYITYPEKEQYLYHEKVKECVWKNKKKQGKILKPENFLKKRNTRSRTNNTDINNLPDNGS